MPALKIAKRVCSGNHLAPSSCRMLYFLLSSRAPRAILAISRGSVPWRLQSDVRVDPSFDFKLISRDELSLIRTKTTVLHLVSAIDLDGDIT
jgi:hypothetical protein